MELTLTTAGRHIAGQIATIEEHLYQLIDAAGAGRDTGEVIEYLRTLVTGQPAGLALARRAGRLPAPPSPRHTETRTP